MSTVKITGTNLHVTYVWPDGSTLEVSDDGFEAWDKDGHHVITAKEAPLLTA